MDSYDNYTLLPDDANDMMWGNLQYISDQKEEELELEILETDLT